MEIKVCKRSVYGKVQVYPVCEKARMFANIAGSKTLTSGTLAQIGFLGYTITYIMDPSLHW